MSVVLDPEGAHLASLQRLVSFEGTHVCEVGCGDGRLTTAMAETALSVFAFDPGPEAVATARAALPARLASRVAFRVGSAREIEIPRSEFDIVLFSWSL
jgi:2-polyprenyl-3-methyl-5-hydroxy-6-metoxy-1,4-benzoquinol methylase